jgi:hypothetical protein
MSAHQTPPYYPTLVNLRTASAEDINAALRHWRGWRLEFDTHTPDPTRLPTNAELPGMWEQADFIDTSEAPMPDTTLTRIAEARTTAQNAQTELNDAVTSAREGGHTWAEIATILGTSRQAAIERYAR